MLLEISLYTYAIIWGYIDIYWYLYIGISVNERQNLWLFVLNCVIMSRENFEKTNLYSILWLNYRQFIHLLTFCSSSKIDVK